MKIGLQLQFWLSEHGILSDRESDGNSSKLRLTNYKSINDIQASSDRLVCIPANALYTMF
jgi:hypothetical protein